MPALRSLFTVLLLFHSAALVPGADGPAPRQSARGEIPALRLVWPESGTDRTRAAAFDLLARRTALRCGRPVRCELVADARLTLERFTTGQADFIRLAPEEYVRLADAGQAVAVAAVLRPGGEYGFRAALLVRPGSPHERIEDILHSTNRVGMLRMTGVLGRFYQSPFTDEKWRLLPELKGRVRWFTNGIALAKALPAVTAAPAPNALAAAIVPLEFAGAMDEEERRLGWKEIWLSPLYPGDVIAVRPGLPKLEWFEFATALVAAGQTPEFLRDSGTGGFKIVDDAAFDVVREYRPGRK